MQPADFYTGIVADVYGALRGTHFGTDRYRSFIEEHGTPALELGCGDDGPFYELTASGVDVAGVDSSEDMVRRGRERLTAQRPTYSTVEDREWIIHWYGRERFRELAVEAGLDVSYSEIDDDQVEAVLRPS